MKDDNKNLKDFMNQELRVKGVKKIIAIASTKGGVGKSTIACNFAIALQANGYKTALVDADIYGPSVASLMNLKGKPEIADGLLLPIISHNIKCISIGNMIDENSAGVWRGPMVTKILHQLIRSINWAFDKQEVDVMVIDMPPGTGDVYLSLAEKFLVNAVLLVSTPQRLAVIDTVKSIDCFNKLKIPILGIIQNMAYLENEGQKQYLFGEDGAKKLAQDYHLNFLGDIKIISEISQCSDQQIPYLIKYPQGELANYFNKLIKDIGENLR
jgi:ATP-binding protein involved in chromosome partitioning